MVPLFGAANVPPYKGTTILYGFRSPKTVLNPPKNGKIQGLLKAFDCFSSTFQGNFYFQGLFKTILYIQILFNPVRTLSWHHEEETQIIDSHIIALIHMLFVDHDIIFYF